MLLIAPPTPDDELVATIATMSYRLPKHVTLLPVPTENFIPHGDDAVVKGYPYRFAAR
jgi:hypothetical protein